MQGLASGLRGLRFTLRRNQTKILVKHQKGRKEGGERCLFQDSVPRRDTENSLEGVRLEVARTTGGWLQYPGHEVTVASTKKGVRREERERIHGGRVRKNGECVTFPRAGLSQVPPEIPVGPAASLPSDCCQDFWSRVRLRPQHDQSRRSGVLEDGSIRVLIQVRTWRRCQTSIVTGLSIMVCATECDGKKRRNTNQ